MMNKEIKSSKRIQKNYTLNREKSDMVGYHFRRDVYYYNKIINSDLLYREGNCSFEAENEIRSIQRYGKLVGYCY